jgi:predicted molibdopterin-dependent oxidoreductase YjgC
MSFEVTAVLKKKKSTLVQVRRELQQRAGKIMSFIERNGVSKDAICKHVGLQVVSACRIMQLPVQGE